MAFVHLIADYGDWGAFAEVQYALRRACGLTVPIIETRVLPLSDTHTGFWVLQHGLVSDPIAETILYVNTAPRFSSPDPCPENDQEPLVYAELDNSVRVLAINAGYCLSWVRDRIRMLARVVYDHGSSQWRSRDAMPQVLRAICTGELFSNVHQLPRLDGRLDPHSPTVIPLPPAGVRVLHVDDYGNIKLSLRTSAIRDWRVGTKVAIEVNGCSPVTCTYRHCPFDIPQGQWVIAPGSSGHADRFLEVWVRRGPDNLQGAAGRIGGVQPGATVLVEPLG